MGFGSSLHAVDHVLKGISAPSITANFGAHAGVSVPQQAASVAGAIKQSHDGLKLAKDARIALSAAANETSQNQNADLGGLEAARGPSFLGQVGQAIGIGALASVSPVAGAVLGAVTALTGLSNPMSSGGRNVIDVEYSASSSFKSFDDSLSEVDAFYAGTGDFEGQTYAQGFATNQPGVQLHMLESARDTVAMLGAKQVQSDLGAASSNEQKLQGQLGATLQFAEKNGVNQGTINNSVANGWSAPKGMGAPELAM